jgi:hypothetical protein
VRNANTRLQLCHNENGWFMCYAAARSGTIIHILNNSAMGSSNICDSSKQTNFSVNLGILDVDLAFIFPIRVMLFSYQKKLCTRHSPRCAIYKYLRVAILMQIGRKGSVASLSSLTNSHLPDTNYSYPPKDSIYRLSQNSRIKFRVRFS